MRMRSWLLSTLVLLLSFSAQAEFTCSVTVGKATSRDAARVGLITWENSGTAAIAAPYVRIVAGDGVLVRFTEADQWTKSLEFLVTSTEQQVSSLKGLEKGELPFLCMASSEEDKIELSYTLSSGEQFPWADIGTSLKPLYVSNDAWAFALATLKSRWGNTWDSYLACLRSDADRLAESGRPVNRIDRLMQMEVNHALGVDPVLPVLASVTDAARSARGLGLSFTRSYSSAMYGRFTKGMLGYGWTDNLSTYAELMDAETLVFRVPGGGSYAFSKLNGAWVPEDPRDKTVLTETASAYKLSGQNGVVMTFAKSNMRTSSIADSSGNALTFTWNGTTLNKITHTDGQSLSFAYSGELLASVTDDCGRTTQYSYLNSLLASVTSSDGSVTKYEYRSADSTAAARALSRIVYPDGTTREFSYDASSGLVSAISVNDGKERTAIARDGLQTTVTGPDGAETVISSGVSGEVLETVDALGGVSSQRYTADGLLASIISPSGLRGTIAHDAQGRVSKSVSAAGHETAFGYEDTFGNLTAVTDAKKHAVTYGYDAKGRGTSVAFADGSASKIEYNDRGDVLRTTNRRGQTVDYAYDARGRVTKKTWSTGRAFTYAYDAHDNVTEASDSETGTVTMEYDAADRLTRIVYPKGRGFTFAYDAAGRLVTRTSLDGVVERFAYDTAGRLASVSDGSGMVYLKNTYDAMTGRLVRQENGNGTSVTYLYDKLGRVVSIEHYDAMGKIAESLQYCYDADGRCLRASSLQGEERYTYDKDGQLTAVDYPDIPDETFAYDAVGNRTTANGKTYTVNDLNQYTAMSDGRTFSYDKDGNLTKMTDASGTTTYAYDTLNRLTAVKNATAGIDWSCQYDVFGNRTSVTDHGVTTERVYLQGSLPSVAAEYVNGKLSSRHILVGAVKVASETDGGKSKCYHADLIGSTRLVTDGNGSIVDRRAYTAFGESRTGERNDSTAGYVGTLGVETDSTGLLFMRNRYYSPALGRFIQPDPIGLDGEDVNWYRYCENKPVIGVDPNGESFIAAGLIFLGKAALAWGYGKIIYDSIKEGFDLVINGTFDEQEWAENAASLVIGGSLGRGAKAVPFLTKRMLPLTVVKKFAPYLARDIIVSWMSKVVVATIPSAGRSKISLNTDNPGPSGGLIMNEGDWLKISTNFEWVAEKDGCVCEVATYSLGADITLTNPKYFVGGFKGKFIGNGHKITVGAGKTIFQDADGATFSTGAFTTDGALFESARNCTFEGCFVTGAFTGGGTGYRTGGLVHDASGCTFKNCSAAGTIVSNERNVGGLVGRASNCKFENCSSSAAVTGKIMAGGIVGDATGCSFAKSRATGTVTAAGWSGGFAGDAKNCSFSMCRASGRVVGQPSLADNSSTDSCRIGGFVGYVYYANEFSDCYSTASVYAPEDEDVGGFVGYADGESDASLVTFRRCYSTGAVTGKTDVGGFAGNIEYFDMADCYSKSATTAIGQDMGGLVSATVGGFFGITADTRQKSKLIRCYAQGKVVAPQSTGMFSLVNVGGFSWYQPFLTTANFSGIECADCYWDTSSTGQLKSLFGQSLSGSSINGKIAAVSWYNDPDQNVHTMFTASMPEKNMAVVNASKFSSLSQVSANLTVARLYSYERYVAVKGTSYSFALSADGGTISVSGLPPGFTFANGKITGTASAVTETSMTITVGGIRKTVPFVVIDAPEKFAATRYFRVVFDGNGGTVSENVRDVRGNESIGTLPSPTRTEYDFVGWFTSKEGGVKISTTTKVTADVVYYAHWTAKPRSAYPELASVSIVKSQLGISDILAVSYELANPSSTADLKEDNLDVYIDGVLTIGKRIEKMGGVESLASAVYVRGATMGAGTHTILVKLRNGKGSFSNSVTVVNDKTADPRMDWAFHKAKSSAPDSLYLGSSLKDMSGRTSFTVGQSIYVDVNFWNAKKVRNLDPVYVQLDLTTGASMFVWWNSLDPGVTGYLTDDVRMPAMLQNLPAGNYTLTATIDPYNNWWETDENNNVKRINFTVVAAGAPHTPVRTESSYLYDESEVSIAVGKGEVAPYASAASVYDGYLVKDGVVKGTIQVKVAKGKIDRKSGEFAAKVTATVQLADGSKKLSFKNGIADETGAVTDMFMNGHALALSLGVAGLGGKFDGKYTIVGARNFFTAKDAESKALAKTIESKWVGAINVVGDDVALAVSVAKKGKVKISGTVGGAKVTATSQLLVGETACCVPVVITKKATLAFNLWLMDDGTVEIDGLDGAVVGKAGTLKTGAKFAFGEAAAKGFAALPGVLTEYLPDGLAVGQNKTKWVVAPDEKGMAAKAGKVMLNRKTGEIDEAKLGENPSALKLTYTAKTGSFKGSFKAYTLVDNKVKAYTFNITGVLIGDKAYGTATLKKPAISIPIVIE